MGGHGWWVAADQLSIQVKFKLPPTKEFDMPYPEPFKLAQGSQLRELQNAGSEDAGCGLNNISACV